MATKEEFNHYQPLGNSDPAHTAIAPGGLSENACNDPTDAGWHYP